MTLKELETSNKLINNLYAIIFLISFILIYIVYWFLNKNPNIKNILALWGNASPNSEGYSQDEAIEIINAYFK